MYLHVDGEKLRRKRLEGLLTQEKLADLSGVHANTISQLESHANRSVRPLTLQRIAVALACAPSDLAEVSSTTLEAGI